jgi:hypothetical protein
MSYTMPPAGYTPPPAPAGQPRPGTVTAACGLLYLLVLISLAIGALSGYSNSLIGAEAYEQIYEDLGMNPAEAADAASFAASLWFIAAVPWVVSAILFLILAIFVAKGKQWARITTWVIGGIMALCCFPVCLFSNATNSLISGMGGTSGVDQDELTRLLQEAQPDWLPPVNTAIFGLGLLVVLVALILLLLPPSNPFFRKPEPQWTPPAYPAP